MGKVIFNTIYALLFENQLYICRIKGLANMFMDSLIFSYLFYI